MVAPVRLHVLDLGKLSLDSSVLVADQPAGAVATVPVCAYVIEHQDGNILFDTGCHPLAMGADGLWPPEYQAQFAWSGGEECHLPNRLAALGLAPDDFSTVVLSHLHNDHAGCVEFFPRTPLIVHADEFSAALAAQQTKDDSVYVSAETERWKRRELTWRLLGREAGDLRLNDSVDILNWGSGHAAGMLGLHVRLPASGNIILASDALYCSANFRPGFRRPGFAQDLRGWEATARHIAALADRWQAQVWFGHDAGQFATLRHPPQGYYD